ncbi:multidrug effflux MFS transporter [Rhizorhabdus argentea]|uniref:multidrug effflux MFS transporter n=1 Tax=Rhizorhabdus argentea TaxID=1387174 RepID=UPI0030ED4BFF
MNAPQSITIERAAHGMRLGEFVALMAALMAVNALGIDTMLPALTMIAKELGVTVENHEQLVVLVYIGCFGVGQLFWGPLADRYGRRNMLVGAMVVYAGMSFIAAHAASFELLLAARATQGLAAASSRVLALSIIRDCYEGRRMAKVTSMTYMAFLAVPIFAPSIGQLILLVAPWQWIFYFLGAFSLMVALWASIRLPETLDPANQRAISLVVVGDAVRQILTNRYSIGYTTAMAAVYGGLVGFINSSQQIFLHTFHAPELFAICFAFMGGFMAVAALINAHFVERFGMRMISHCALLAMVLLCLVRLGVVAGGHETLLLFTLLNGLTFFFYGLTGANFGAMAMAPMAHLAGTASSVQGFIQTSIATLAGLVIGQSFAGTTLPLTLGWELMALAALAIVLIAERGRLFRPQNPQPSPLR